MKKVWIFFLIAISIAIVGGLAWYDQAQREATEIVTLPPNESQEEIKRIWEKEEVEPKVFIVEEGYYLKQTGWIPSWDFQAGFDSLKEKKDSFYSISPVWYTLESDGTITSNEIQKEEFLEYCSDNGIKVIPSIASFSHEGVREGVNTPESFRNHIDSILEIVDDPRISGIDLDYESIELEDKENFLKFVKQLAAELHEIDKILSVTVIPKWGDNVIYSSLPQTREVQDWEVIGEHADELRIMTYDYSGPHTPVPGPIAPLPWVNQVIAYALTQTTPDKIWLGVHLYSYEWVNVKYDPNTDIETIAPVNDVDVNSYTRGTVLEVLDYSGTTSHYDSRLGEGIATYDCLTDSFCTLFYPTVEGIDTRKGIAEDIGLAGVAYWKIGRDEHLLNQ